MSARRQIRRIGRVGEPLDVVSDTCANRSAATAAVCLIRNVQITEDGFTVQDKVFNNFGSYTQLQYAYTFSGLLIFSIGYGIPGYACKHADPFQHVHKAVLQS